jgi:hypothetical protein
MLIFSPFECGDINNTIVLNLSSYKEGFYRLKGLNPLNYYSIGISSNYEFDLWYANFIITNKDAYKEFIDIMRYLYNGVDVCILTDYRLDFSNLLVESLSKFISERYGYISNIIKDIDDINYIKDGEFTISGLLLLDKEFDQYIYTYGSKSLYSTPE